MRAQVAEPSSMWWTLVLTCWGTWRNTGPRPPPPPPPHARSSSQAGGKATKVSLSHGTASSMNSDRSKVDFLTSNASNGISSTDVSKKVFCILSKFSVAETTMVLCGCVIQKRPLVRRRRMRAPSSQDLMQPPADCSGHSQQGEYTHGTHTHADSHTHMLTATHTC